MGNANFSLQKEDNIEAHDMKNIILITNNYIISISLGAQLDIFDIQKKLNVIHQIISLNFIQNLKMFFFLQMEI